MIHFKGMYLPIAFSLLVSVNPCYMAVKIDSENLKGICIFYFIFFTISFLFDHHVYESEFLNMCPICVDFRATGNKIKDLHCLSVSVL